MPRHTLTFVGLAVLAWLSPISSAAERTAGRGDAGERQVLMVPPEPGRVVSGLVNWTAQVTGSAPRFLLRVRIANFDQGSVECFATVLAPDSNGEHVLSVLDFERVPGASVTAERVGPVELRPLDSAVDEKVDTSRLAPADAAAQSRC